MKGFALIAAGAALAGCSPAGGTTWHVDYRNGSDQADGRSPATAWKHAPGDRAATARPAGASLQPGDKVLFRAGVPYRGTIVLPASGTAQKPITYSGLGWDKGMGIIDGSDPVTTARPCQSSADCGGAQNWQGLTRVEYAKPQTARIVLYGAKGLYWLSQLPDLPDPFFSDNRHSFATISRSQLSSMRSGSFTSPQLAKAAKAGGRMELAFWVRPNLVQRRPLLRVEGDRLFFDPTDLDFYDNRDGAVALNGSFEGLQSPGRYVVVAEGVLVARLLPGDTAASLSIGSGRMGFNLNGQSDVVISGLHFRNMTGSRAGQREGRAVTSLGANARNIEVSGNLFGPALLENGSGIVHLQGSEGFRFIANRVENIAFGGGFRASGGSPRNITVAGNVIRRTGRTAIGVLGVQGAQIKGNVLAEIKGVHGNGITAYLGNQDITIEGNCVVSSNRPLTYHGDKKGEMVNRIRIVRNILISTPDGQAAINSWGGQTRDVLIESNLLVGPKHGLLMNRSERQVVVRGNDTSGIATRGDIPPDWTLADNRENLSLASVAGGQFSEEGCAVPGSRIPPVVRFKPKG
ncbi:right-handed parallel beta-helix repeat-containing protein [Sandaracinobacter sp. RS1-74]|uniref:right-handed parallel beta-helix repeat-containing protein n=1 Tax=Sandaracinobacteroides sayramensis TaxID=2913411 RepID=UPI001EDB29D0|nr:right-handed parallel beta-helix repeat-containing protein [Sandaracinobacteroides sayramensis]MCG2841766.1 right-handed parallel beta-helix repeat-containing protein [Sandaracinobacteroides sayramensis]